MCKALGEKTRERKPEKLTQTGLGVKLEWVRMVSPNSSLTEKEAQAQGGVLLAQGHRDSAAPTERTLRFTSQDPFPPAGPCMDTGAGFGTDGRQDPGDGSGARGSLCRSETPLGAPLPTPALACQLGLESLGLCVLRDQRSDSVKHLVHRWLQRVGCDSGVTHRDAAQPPPCPMEPGPASRDPPRETLPRPDARDRVCRVPPAPPASCG